ncbi:MAG: J domain-containing protein [Treponema sp.]|jgi:hypothetical protein|nr:J domain-containing protein [Treponema sp.]
MSLFDRVGAVIKSYLNDEDARIFKRSSQNPPYDDPDIQAAFEELNDFLGGKKKSASVGGGSRTEYRRTEYTKGGARYSRTEYSRTEWSQPRGKPKNGRAGAAETVNIPESLRNDFAELGVPFGAKPEICKNAYKKLLKIHHPDRHAGHPGQMALATERCARINASYDRIERWRATGIA